MIDFVKELSIPLIFAFLKICNGARKKKFKLFQVIKLIGFKTFFLSKSQSLRNSRLFNDPKRFKILLGKTNAKELYIIFFIKENYFITIKSIYFYIPKTIHFLLNHSIPLLLRYYHLVSNIYN